MGLVKARPVYEVSASDMVSRIEASVWLAELRATHG